MRHVDEKGKALEKKKAKLTNAMVKKKQGRAYASVFALRKTILK